ncbi:MAG TPA: phytanoyl-CoA dioxygenase family protein [Aldersonia sp.]
MTRTTSIQDFDITTMARRFAEDGTVQTPPVLSPEDLADVRGNIDRYCIQLVPMLAPHIREETVRYESDGESIRSCYFMDQIDEYFRDLGNSPMFKDLVRGVVGYDVELYVVETFNKNARVGSAAPPHQDCAFMRVQPNDVVNLWISIDRATAQNGAVRYWKGSHRNGLLPHVDHHYGLRADEACVDHDAELIVAELEPGAASLHSGLVLHDSPQNTSGQARLGLICGYRGVHTRFLRE